MAAWKKSFRKIPAKVLKKLETITSDTVIVSAVKEIELNSVENGLYEQVGLRWVNGSVTIDPASPPPAEYGRHSLWNLFGREIELKHLPKITKTYSWETPNFGDGAIYGYHTHYRSREVYQRKFVAPRFLTVASEILAGGGAGSDRVVVQFALNVPLGTGSDDFLDELFFHLNLLQECTGVSDVFPADADRSDFLRTITLDWEIFPPGTIDEIRARLLGDRRGLTPSRVVEMGDRIELFSKLEPTAYIRGGGGFGSYVGAKYADNLIVFENVQYGNALYVLYDDWEDVSKRSRIDLIRGTSVSYDRFLHTDGWQERFLNHMRQQLLDRGMEPPNSLFRRGHRRSRGHWR